MHQKTMVAAANEARAFLKDAYAKLDAVDTNRDLRPGGKRRQRAELGSEIIAKMQASSTPVSPAESGPDSAKLAFERGSELGRNGSTHQDMSDPVLRSPS